MFNNFTKKLGALSVFLTVSSFTFAGPEKQQALNAASEAEDHFKNSYIEITCDFKLLSFYSPDSVHMEGDSAYVDSNIAINAQGDRARIPVKIYEEYEWPCQIYTATLHTIEQGENRWYEFKDMLASEKLIVYNGQKSLIQTKQHIEKTDTTKICESIEPGKANIPRHYSLSYYLKLCSILPTNKYFTSVYKDNDLVSLREGTEQASLELFYEDPSNGTVKKLVKTTELEKSVNEYDDFVLVDGYSIPTKWTISDYDANGQLIKQASYSNIKYQIRTTPSGKNDSFSITRSYPDAKPVGGQFSLLRPQALSSGKKR